MKNIHHCELCNEDIVTEQSGNSLSLKFRKHLKEKHQLTLEEYAKKVYFNNEQPTCACGCGSALKFDSKAYWHDNIYHGFGKYCSCTHVKPTNDSINKMKNTNLKKWNNCNWRADYVDKQWGLENIKRAAIDFIAGKSYGEITDTLKIDKRTLRSIWIDLGLISDNDYIKIRQNHQFSHSSKLRRFSTFANAEEICIKLYAILEANPLKYNIRSLIKTFNSFSEENIIAAPEVVYLELKKYYGDTIDTLLCFGYHSKEEIQFAEILYFYFKQKHIICGKKIKYGSNKRYSYTYDFCINNKLLIEYDGDGYYHPEERRDHDNEKENFARQHNYNFIRLTFEDIHKIETLKKLKNYYEI